MNRFLRTVISLGVCLAADALAQTYPAKPVRVVVPYTAGGPADLLVRFDL